VLAVPFLAACAAAVPDSSVRVRLLPLLLFGMAAATDVFDGRVARRTGAVSSGGQVLDNVADLLFVGPSLLFFAARGQLAWWVPVAVAAAVAAYVRDSWRESRSAGDVYLARSAVGHAAGVMNYALVGLMAADAAISGSMPNWLIDAAGLATAGTNLLAVGGRFRAGATWCYRTRWGGQRAPRIGSLAGYQGCLSGVLVDRRTGDTAESDSDQRERNKPLEHQRRELDDV
jgi:phosphatidylglycerophosphate synthase